jgi:putative addiction module component (TIGR02574 family)
MRTSDIPELDKLSISEKILFLEDLWDSISMADTEIHVPPSHIEELDLRMKNYKSNRGNVLTLDELKRNLTNRK